MTTLAAALVALMLVSRMGLRRVAAGALIAGGLAMGPVAGLGLLAATAGLRFRPRRHHRRPDPLAPVEVAQLLAIGVAAGLTVRQSLAFCAERGPPELRPELSALLRRAQFDGLEVAAAAHEGRLASLATVIGTAARSGAPIELMLRSHAGEARAQIAGRRISRARRLPGVLAVPLALLLLPGFVLLVMGPAVL